MSLTRRSIRIVDWMPCVQDGMAVEHAVDQGAPFDWLCGSPAAFEFIRKDGRLQCVECQRQLFKLPPRRARLLENPDR